MFLFLYHREVYYLYPVHTGVHWIHVVQQDIKEQKELEEQRRMEQMPKGSVLKQLEWATQKRQMENQQHKENKTKYRGLEI